jgi:hypothetical protein
MYKMLNDFTTLKCTFFSTEKSGPVSDPEPHLE